MGDISSWLSIQSLQSIQSMQSIQSTVSTVYTVSAVSRVYTVYALYTVFTSEPSASLGRFSSIFVWNLRWNKLSNCAISETKIIRHNCLVRAWAGLLIKYHSKKSYKVTPSAADQTKADEEKQEKNQDCDHEDSFVRFSWAFWKLFKSNTGRTKKMSHSNFGGQIRFFPGILESNDRNDTH